MRRAWTLSDKSDESREDGLGELLRTLHAAININSAWPGNGRDPEAAAAAASTAASIHGQRWEARDAEALTTAAPLGHSYSWPSSAGEEGGDPRSTLRPHSESAHKCSWSHWQDDEA
jgi:hypothetical protein